jgi:ribosome-interacting GTPase 1
MPANLSPEYKKAEADFRRARDPADRLSALKEMLRTIPKHKGTEHLQADIKSRIKQLTEELAGPRKGGARTGPVQVIRPEGAAQVALLGPPNVGKSSLHALLTGSQADVGPYPHTTTAPQPGMLTYEDVQFQLIDLPPISATFMDAWLPNALQPAQACLLVVNLNVAGCVEDVAAIRQRLADKRIHLTDDWGGRLPGGLVMGEAIGEAVRAGLGAVAGGGLAPAVLAGEAASGAGAAGGRDDELDDPFRIDLPTILLANKHDQGFDPEEIAVLEELVGADFPALCVSTKTDEGIDLLGPLLFHGLGLVRVYTKIPGKPPDMSRPYTVSRGETVADVARLIHRDMASGLRFARVWGSGKFDGQQVGRDHIVQDGDVLEIHT